MSQQREMLEYGSNRSIRFSLIDATTRQGLTGKVFGDFSISATVDNSDTNALPVAAESAEFTWNSGGIAELDAVLAPGAYRYHLPNSITTAVGQLQTLLSIKVAGAETHDVIIDWVPYNPQLIGDVRLASDGLDAVQRDGVNVPGFMAIVLAYVNGKTSKAGAIRSFFSILDDERARIVSGTLDGAGNRATAGTLDADE